MGLLYGLNLFDQKRLKLKPLISLFYGVLVSTECVNNIGTVNEYELTFLR